MASKCKFRHARASALGDHLSGFTISFLSKNSKMFTRPFCAAVIDAKSLIGHPRSNNHSKSSRWPNSDAFCVVRQSHSHKSFSSTKYRITSIFPNLAANVANLVRSIGHLHSMAYSIKSIEEANSDGLNLWFCVVDDATDDDDSGEEEVKEDEFLSTNCWTQRLHLRNNIREVGSIFERTCARVTSG